MRPLSRNRIRCCGTAFGPVIVALMALTACLPRGGGPSSTPTLDGSLFDLSILTGEPCAAPCWYGLEPGRSTEEQVLATAQTLPFLDSKGIEELPYHYRDPSRQIDKTGTYLRLKCRRPGEETCTGLLLFDGILTQIDLSPPPSLTFGEAVAHLGPPDSIRSYPVPASPSACNLGMIWKERAIWVAFLNAPPKKDQVKCVDVERGRSVDPDLPVGQVVYSTPDDALFTAPPGASGTERWPGFAQP